MTSTLITCAIHRISFLQSHEKFILHGMELSEAEFLRLNTRVLRNLGLCGRRRGEVYDPHATLELARKDCSYLERSGWFLVPLWSAEYPRLLRQIYDPPFALYVRTRELSDNLFNDRPCLAMVGTRKPSSEGGVQARELSRQLSLRGVTVVSGLARGIDSAAHIGALVAEGRTIAVLGHGCDSIYPRANTSLAAGILQNHGALISEYPPGTSPLPFRFPQRNRIISGLSLGVLLVEAPEKSGALITVDFALEQGRDVMVVSSLVHSRRNRGGAALQEMGAPAGNTADEILDYILY